MNYVQAFVNSTELEGVAGQFSFTISKRDLKDIAKRSGTRSIEWELPRTKVNEVALGITAEPAVFTSVNKNTGHPFYATENMAVVFNGLLYVSAATETTVQVVCVESIGALKDIIGDKTLNDLRLNDLRHTYSDTNVFNSWTADNDYFYPLVDYGLFRNRPGNSALTPTVFYELYPACKASRILKQICEDNDIILDTDIFAMPYIEKLYLCFSNQQLNHTDAWVNERYTVVNNISAGVNYLASGVILMNNEVTDELNQFDLANSEYVANQAQRCDVKFTFFIPNAIGAPEIGLEYYDPNLLTWFPVPDTFQEVIVAVTKYTITASDVLLENGWKIRAACSLNAFEAVQVLLPELEIKPQKKVYRTSDIDIAVNLPNMKQVDFLRELVNLFNLEVDYIDQQRTLRIFTQEQYYTGDVVDWSRKLDLSSAPEITYVGDDAAYILEFKHSETDDARITQFNTATQTPVPFGDGQAVLDSKFNNERKTVVDAKTRAVITTKSYRFGVRYMYIPAVFPEGLEPNNEQTGTDPFFLIFQGMTAIENITDGTYNQLITGEGLVSRTEVPLNYFVKPRTGTEIDNFDVNLCFDMPPDAFPLVWNGRGLIDECYSTTVNELNTLRMVKCRINLDAVDISNLDLRKYVYIDYFQATFKIEKINNYTPGTARSTEVQLIRIQQ